MAESATRCVHISALPILALGVLEGLAQRLGCQRHEAAKSWAGIYAATMPYMHTRLATLTIRPEGAPDSDPAELDWALTAEGELIDVTPPPRVRAFGDVGKGYSRGASLGHVDELPRKCSYTIKGTSRTICVKAYYRCWTCIDFNCMRKIS